MPLNVIVDAVQDKEPEVMLAPSKVMPVFDALSVETDPVVRPAARAFVTNDSIEPEILVFERTISPER